MRLIEVCVAAVLAGTALTVPAAADPTGAPTAAPSAPTSQGSPGQAGPGAAGPAPQSPAASQGTPAPSGKAASEATPDVATLLFSLPQWGQAPVGSTLTYDFSHKASEAMFGAPFDDHIILKLDAGDDPKSRTAEVRMFSGLNAKPAGPFQADQQNPVLLLVLENNLQELSKLFRANPRYLKNAIRKAWRDNAKIERTDITVNGSAVPGTRISIRPFVGDAEASNMLGLDGMVYVVEIADSVPGNIANIDIHAPAEGTPKFSETLHYRAIKKP